ncbi:MAG: amidohydrolase [Bacteroidales bacterium]|nr:amidohydrolase [Bacteroidales bacterium]
MQNLKINIIQSDIYWNNPSKNLKKFGNLIDKAEAETNIIVLPEMFTTGFNLQPQGDYSSLASSSLEWMQEKAAKKQAVLCGSILVEENEHFYNRLFWVEPSGQYETYDKKHLFSYAGEHKVFTAGNFRKIVHYEGFNFLLIICYDLRFPVWCRNRFSNGTYAYDAIVCVANWPEVRSQAWKTLLQARAIENQAYVIGVNRVGKDINNMIHSGDSMVIDPKGEILTQFSSHEEGQKYSSINKEHLLNFRSHFMAAADWDNFEIKNT